MLKRSGSQMDCNTEVLCGGIIRKLQEQQESLGDVEQQCKRIRLELDSAFDMLNLTLFKGLEVLEDGRPNRERNITKEEEATCIDDENNRCFGIGQLSRSRSESCLLIQRKRHIVDRQQCDLRNYRNKLDRRCASLPALSSWTGDIDEIFEEESIDEDVNEMILNSNNESKNCCSMSSNNCCEPIDLSVQSQQKRSLQQSFQTSQRSEHCHGSSTQRGLFYPPSSGVRMGMMPPSTALKSCPAFSFSDCLLAAGAGRYQQNSMSAIFDNNCSLERFIQVDASQNVKWRELAERYAKDLAPNICGICGKTLSCKSALTMHYRVHTEERPFVCKICRKRFSTKGNLKTHLGQHGDTIDTIKPEVQPRLFPTNHFGLLTSTHLPNIPTSLSSHMVSEEDANIVSSIANDNLLNGQMEVNNENPLTSSLCEPHCSDDEEEQQAEQFDSNRSPDVHHPTSEEMLHGATSPMSQSDATTAGAVGLLSRRREYCCDTCGKVFPTKSALQIHNRSHTGEKPFTCTDCGKPFSTQGNMKTHREKHCPSRRHKDPTGGGINLLNKPVSMATGLHLSPGCGTYPGMGWPHMTSLPPSSFVPTPVGDMWSSILQHQHHQHQGVNAAIISTSSSPFSSAKALLSLSAVSAGNGSMSSGPPSGPWFLPPGHTGQMTAVYPRLMPPSQMMKEVQAAAEVMAETEMMDSR